MKKFLFSLTGYFLLAILSGCTSDLSDRHEDGLDDRNFSSLILDEFLEKYEIVTFDTPTILAYSLGQEKRNSFVLDFHTDSYPDWIFNVSSFDEFFDEDYKEYDSNERGDWIEVIPGRSDTYTGYSEDGRSHAIFSFNDDYFSGVVFTGKEEYALDPLRLYVPDASPNLYVIYRPEDDMTGRVLFCETPEFDLSETIVNDDFEKAANCFRLTVSYVADYHYYVNRGGSNTTTTRNFINNRLKFASYRYWNYNSYPLYFRLSNSSVRTSTANQPSSATNTSDALSQFRTWGRNGNMTLRNTNILFAGRNFGSSFGIAYVGTVCKTTSAGQARAFALVTNSSSASSSAVWNKVVAHEVGHNLGAGHTTSGFMQQGNHSNSTMPTVTKNELNAHIGSNNSCMSITTCVNSSNL